MQAVVKVPGSCGELVQGTLDGKNLLISCPVNLFSWVSVTITGEKTVTGPPDRKKTITAVEMALEYLGAKQGARVAVYSQMPTGKGMASSTADVVGATMATARALGKTLSEKEIAQLALSVEPSDGTFLPGISLFDHVYGTRMEFLGEPPKLNILALDTGGTVDTLAFNKRTDLIQLNKEKEDNVSVATDLVKRGLNQRNSLLLAKGATISALANQIILYKPLLCGIWSLGQHFGALGVNIAHSGTIIGLLFPTNTNLSKITVEIEKHFPQIKQRYYLRLISGGVRTAASREVVQYGLG